MLGVLFLPLIALGLLQTVIAAFLLAPLTLARPVIRITKQTRTPAGWTVIATISVILLAFLISALYEIAEVHGNARKGSGETESMHRRCALKQLNFRPHQSSEFLHLPERVLITLNVAVMI